VFTVAGTVCQNQRVLMVGLTGGIGAGKSVVAKRLAERGAVVIDADALAREVVAPGTPALAEVAAVFGPGVLTPDGAMDRAAVAALVFGDDEKRSRLEAIIHPRVRELSTRMIASARPDAVVVNDVPLLVESGTAARFDLVIVVLAAEAVRLDRLVSSRAMTEETVRARFAAQATDEQRRAVADVVIVNEGTPEELAAMVDAVWDNTIEPMAGSK
jgi:dephospho-CoA kinase